MSETEEALFFKNALTNEQWRYIAKIVDNHANKNRFVLTDEERQACLEFYGIVKILIVDN